MQYLLILPLAFICEFMDSSLGMGYGTTLTPLLLLMGFEPLQVVPAVLMSECVTCFVGILVYFLTKSAVDWSLAPWLMMGAVFSVPFAAHTVKNISEKKVKTLIAVVVIILGMLTLSKAIF
jgi:uncharacterized membrane protein YfcA